MRGLIAIIFLVFSFAAFANAPLCGVDPSGTVRPHTLPAETTPLALSVDHPADGAAVSEESLDIHGTFRGPPNTGIAVNGAAALQGDGQFLAHRLRLKPGKNVISVVLTAASGQTQAVSRTVTYTPAAAIAGFRSAHAGDYVPFDLRFTVSVPPDSSHQVIRDVKLDYDGDGVLEVDASTVPERPAHQYLDTGLKKATLRLTLADSAAALPDVVFTSTLHMMGEDLDQTRQTLCHVVETFRDHLRAHDYRSAIATFSAHARPTYEGFLMGLGENGAKVADGLGDIVDGTIGTDFAELTLARPIPGNPGNFHSYALQLVRDSDGVWRIASL